MLSCPAFTGMGDHRIVRSNPNYARNFLAVVDAYDLLQVADVSADGQEGRAALKEYPHTGLGVQP